MCRPFQIISHLVLAKRRKLLSFQPQDQQWSLHVPCSSLSWAALPPTLAEFGGLGDTKACVALQVMEGGAYIAALLRLCRHSSEAVIRRALKLITTSVAKLSLQEQPDSKVTCCTCHEVLVSFAA